MERMREPSRRGREKRRERRVSPRQENGGVPARTLNLLNALARAWNASISLFYFGPFVLVARSLPFLQFRPFYSRRPNESEPTGRQAATQPFLSSRSRARSCRFDDPSVTIWRWFNCLRLKWSTCKLSFFTAPAFYLVLDGRVFDVPNRSIGLTQPDKKIFVWLIYRKIVCTRSI